MAAARKTYNFTVTFPAASQAVVGGGGIAPNRR